MCRYAVVAEHPDYQDVTGLKALYIRNTEAFPEEELFIEQCIGRYVNRNGHLIVCYLLSFT